jgi:hypothetical protein
MNEAQLVNGSVLATPAEQRVLEKLRQLPPEAVQQAEDFLDFLLTRRESKTDTDPTATSYALELLNQELFLRVMRQMPPQVAQLAVEYVMTLAGLSMKWSYDDPVSLARAAELMAYDPFMRREIDAINREFSVCDADGLEDY